MLTRFDLRTLTHWCYTKADRERQDKNRDMDSTDVVSCPGENSWELELRIRNIWKGQRSFNSSDHKWLWSTTKTLTWWLHVIGWSPSYSSSIDSVFPGSSSKFLLARNWNGKEFPLSIVEARDGFTRYEHGNPDPFPGNGEFRKWKYNMFSLVNICIWNRNWVLSIAEEEEEKWNRRKLIFV